MSFDGFTVEGIVQDGQAGISIRDADEKPLGFIPDSFFVAEETRKPWRTQGKCLVIHTSLLLMAGSFQAMTCQDAAQSTAPMITDIFHGELEDEFYPRPGKYLPSLLTIAIGLSAYYFCRDRTPPPQPPSPPVTDRATVPNEEPLSEENGPMEFDSRVPAAASGLLGVMILWLTMPQARLASILTSIFDPNVFSIKDPNQI
jgi:hypothetical protein